MCEEDYGINEGRCEDCADTNCLKCPDNVHVCESCKEGYGLN